MNTKQTPENSRSKIYLWWNLPVTPETPMLTFHQIPHNTNTILPLGKGVPTISILKPNKDHNIDTSYRSISLLSPIAKALVKALLP